MLRIAIHLFCELQGTVYAKRPSATNVIASSKNNSNTHLKSSTPIISTLSKSLPALCGLDSVLLFLRAPPHKATATSESMFDRTRLTSCTFLTGSCRLLF